MSERATSAKISLLGFACALWGLLGFSLLMGRALWRLVPMALVPIADPETTTVHMIVYAASVAFMAYSEGYRGFQLRFAPRFGVRAKALADAPTLLTGLLAPFYCMALFSAPRRRLIASWVLLGGIVVLVLLVRLLPQPWRGIVDGGVVVGLGYGLAVTVVFWVRAIAGHSIVAPE